MMTICFYTHLLNELASFTDLCRASLAEEFSVAYFEADTKTLNPVRSVLKPDE